MGLFSLPSKPHAVCVPAPAQSHIKAMLKLAKLLHHKGFHITFANTEFNHRRFLRSRGSDSLNGLPDFQFRHFPDGLPPSEADATQDVASVTYSINHLMLAPFCSLLSQLNEEAIASSASYHAPPPTCIVSDGFTPFAVEAADTFGLPLMSSFSIPACSVMAIFQFRSVLDRGLTPLPDESYFTNGFLDTPIDWIPGMKNMRLKDLPSLFWSTDPNNSMFTSISKVLEAAPKARVVLIQTFDALEVDVLNALSDIFPHVYAAGPLQLMLNQIPNDQNNLNSIGYNLWKEEVECLQWLDSKEPNSVIFVNFGSIVALTHPQLFEFCWGLADSKCNFLLIIRPDMIDGGELPTKFLEEIKERGKISGWCPQEQVLNHPSTGGFLTHSGWNSTTESLSSGVPMLCCPFFADQPTNCRYTCKEWDVGIEINVNSNRDEVKTKVNELIHGEKGKKLRDKALEWKKLAKDATNLDGSSWLNLDKAVNQLLRATK